MSDELPRLKQPHPPPQAAAPEVKATGIGDTSSENPAAISSTPATAIEDSPHNMGGERWITIFEAAPEIARHTVSLLLSLFSLWLIHLTIKYLLGDPKFFGVVPVQWIVDAGDVVILIKFIWHLIKNFNK